LASSASQKAPDRKIWLDGEIRPWADATVHVLSHSVQRGSLVFDYMSVHDLPDGNGAGLPPGAAVFRLGEHIERFFHSCELMGLPLEQDFETLRDAICETVRANPGARAVKISAYFASIEIDVVPVDTHVTVAIAAYDPKADIQERLPMASPPKPRTVKLWIEKETANRRDDIVPPQAKVSANYASPMMAKTRARLEGYDEIVLVDEDGNIAEAPTSNFFLVNADGELLTPRDTKVLHGVTRSSIVEIAKAEGVPFRETEITPADLMNASEAFLTGTTAGVWPAESVDRQSLGSCPGPVSSRLQERFKRVARGDDPDFAHWLTPTAG